MPQYPTYEANQVLKPTGVPDLSTGTGIASGLAQIGRAGVEITDDLLFDQRREAQARGVERGPAFVYRDQGGNLAVSNDLPGLDSGVEGRAARAAAEQTYHTLFQNDAEAQARVLRQQFQYDPQGFSDAWRDYSQRNVAGAPEAWLTRTRNTLDMIGNQHLAGITVDVSRRQESGEKSGWEAALKQSSNELIGLSEQGLAGDPRYTELLATHDQQLKLGLQRGWIDPQTEAIARENQVVQGKAAGVAGIILRDVQGQMAGGMSRSDALRYGMEQRDKLLGDPQFASMTARERETVRDRTDERLHEMLAVNRADTTALDQEVRVIGQGVMRGMGTPIVRLGEIAGQYQRMGEPEKAAEARALAERGQQVEAFSKLPITEQQRRLADINAGIATPETVKASEALTASLSRSERDSRAEVANIRQNLAAFATGEQAGMGSDPAAITSAIEQQANRLRDLGQGELADDLMRNVNAARTAQEAGQGSIGSLADATQRSMRAFPSPENVATAKMMQHAYEEKAKALREDPLTYGAQLRPDAVGQLKPLDFSAVGTQRSGEFVAALQERKRQAAVVSAAENGYPVPPMTAAELGTLKRVVEAGNADQKAATAAALNDGLGEDGLAELTPHLFKGEAKQRAFGVAAEIASQSPDTARAIFVGQDILDGRGGEKVSVMPPAADVVRKYQEALYPVFDPFGSADPTEAMTRQSMSAVTDRYQATTDAATAFYAYLARGQDNPNFDRLLGQAVTAVTGGVLSGPNGTKIMAPRRGLTQSEFDGLWGNLTADDLGEMAPALNGQRITVDQVRQHGALQSNGDGHYSVFLQQAGGPHQLMRPDRQTPVIIDLSRKVAPPASRWPSGIGLFN